MCPYAGDVSDAIYCVPTVGIIWIAAFLAMTKKDSPRPIGIRSTFLRPYVSIYCIVCHIAIAAHCPTLRDSLTQSIGIWMTQSTDARVEASTHSGSLPTSSAN